MEIPQAERCVLWMGAGHPLGDRPCLPSRTPQDLEDPTGPSGPPGFVCLAACFSLHWLHAGYFALPSYSSQAPALSPSLSLLISLSFRSLAWVLSLLAPR